MRAEENYNYITHRGYAAKLVHGLVGGKNKDVQFSGFAIFETNSDGSPFGAAIDLKQKTTRRPSAQAAIDEFIADRQKQPGKRVV